MPDQAEFRQARQSRLRKNMRLIELRLNAGMSREDLALAANVSRETIRLLETTDYVPHIGTQLRVAKVFGLGPLDLWPLKRQKVVQR